MIIMLFLFSALNSKCIGQNLVPNPSFEEYTACPSLSPDGQIINAPPWFQPNTYYGLGGSTDYFNQCYSEPDGYGVPSNFWGYQFAHSGVAYAGLSPFFCYGCNNGREYLEVELTSALVQGVTYHVSFYVCTATGFTRYAIDRLGIHFSKDLLIYSSSNSEALLLPCQVENQHGNVVHEDSIWTELSGQFVAEGGEKFITIGNFYNDDQTTIDSLIPQLPVASGSAYYYIDDVLVIPDSLNFIQEIELSDIGVWPIPTKVILNIESKNVNFTPLQIEVLDIWGLSVLRELTNSSKFQLNLSGLASGLYNVLIRGKEGGIVVKKVVKE
jgi:hypothetical protein